VRRVKETVYILGAGVNQTVEDWDGHRPPLMSNFFNIVLQKRKFADKYYIEQIQDVLDYITKWKLKQSKEDLARSPFDLEMLFTFIEKQIHKAEQINDKEETRRLITIKFRLESLLAEVLSDFEFFSFTSHSMRNLGKVILYDKPTIISFNYDCLIEGALELASGVNPSLPKSFIEYHTFEDKELPDDLLAYSHNNWNRPLGYGFRFDEVELQQAGISKFARGSRFYSISQNQLYKKPLLKLHGSLNWFRYTHPPIRSFPILPDEPEPRLGQEESDIILKRGTWWFNRPPDHNGWFVLPLIITPILYKDEYYDLRPFKEIWEKAKKALSECKRLVIIGYSFSPSDFATKHLLIESFAANTLDELIVVNPNHDVVRISKDLCHFNGGVVWYSSLDDYLNSFSGVVQIESKPLKIPEEEIPKDTSPHDLYTKCKTCGVEFRVGIRTSPRSFATSQYIGNVHKCPNGHSVSYDKKDYIFRKVDD
jgi:hypothetical protein